MPSVHLVDATYELFRHYFAVPKQQAPDGLEVGAVRGVLGTLLNLIRYEGGTHIGCASDHVIRSFRNDLYPGYKTEEGVAPDLLAQFPVVEEAMRALGLVVWPMVEWEADDAMASAAAHLSGIPDVDKIYLASPDKDLAQCVSGTRVVMLNRREKRIIDEEGVKAKWGVPPRAIPDWLALVGDSADGYPGVPAWGARSASAVLAVYGSIEAIPDDSRRWTVRPRGAERLAASLAAHREEVALYKRLATLRTDAPTPESLDELRWRGPTAAFPELCARLGFPDLAERVIAST